MKKVLFAVAAIVIFTPTCTLADLSGMVFIPGGEFQMGDHHDGVSDAPVHTVYVDSFYMSKYEVTNQQYCDYLNSANSAGSIKVVSGIVYATGDSSNSQPYFNTYSASSSSQIDYNGSSFSVRMKGSKSAVNYPVVKVSWYGAKAYCDFCGYRLPTEAEWEYAARGGHYNPYYRFPCGDTISQSLANYSYHPAYNDGIVPYTSPVGSFPAEGYGLYDMAGNVWEWCYDWYSSGYYGISPYNNPNGPQSGSTRVARGGIWAYGSIYCRVAFRNSGSPDVRNNDGGFRVVHPLTGPSGAPPANDYFLGQQEQKSGSSSDPVNTATGNFIHEETDLSIMSRGIPLGFSRYYNSKDNKFGPLGQGWTYSYNIFLKEDANMVSVCWGDGHADFWHRNGDVYEPNTVGLYDKLVKNPNSTWTITKKNLDFFSFDALGRLASITDKNGNAIQLAYNHPTEPNLVTSITDPVGGTLTLAYTSGLLTSITDFDSPARVVQYNYMGGRLVQVIDVFGNPITYTYDLNGYLASITDQRGVTTVANVYDGNGRVIQQRDGNNNLTQFAYDSPGAGQTTITDPCGKTTIHTHFSGYKLLASVTDPLGHSIEYTYDVNCNRTSITDRNGHTTTFVYDSRGNVISTMEPNDPNYPYDGGITSVEYGDSNFPDLPTKKIDALGNITRWEYDDKGNVKKQVDPNGGERLWTYNSFGQKLTEQDERGVGYLTQYVYDGDGKLTETIDPNGNHTWYGYDALWRLTHITDGRGSSAGDPAHTTITTYDNADHILSITGPITSESYQYNNVGNRTHATNKRGYTTTFQYDNNNNLIRIERPAPASQTQVTQYSYDSLNREISITDPNGNITRYEYDAAGRMTKVTNAEGNQTVYTYDAQGNVLTQTDGAGVKVTFEYDSLNRKVHQYDLLGNHWRWQYDKLGRVTRYTDAVGNVTNYGYDSFGRLTSVTDATNKTTKYQYDVVGNLTDVNDAGGIISTEKFYDKSNRLVCQKDANGNAYEYNYDGAGNLISRKDPQNQTTTYIYDNQNRLIETHYPDSTQVVNSYDNNGNLISSTGTAGTTTFVYDELNRLTSSTDCFSRQVLYGYDITGNRTSVTYPADANNPARTVIYLYDKANRLDKITDWTSQVWDYTVDGAGRTKQVTYPSGIKEVRSYNNAARLSALSYKKSDDTTLINYSYIRDAQGNPTNITETGTLSPNPQLPVKVSYNYDADNRLTDSSHPASYSYDNNGNLTSRTVNGTATSLSYDFENRLISQSTGSSNVQHVYDSLGNRIARIQNGITTRYILDYGRDMSHILCETDGSGLITAYYIHGTQIVGRIGTDGSVRYYHSDHIGNIVALTDGSQNITDKYAYTPFGVPAGKQGLTANPFTFVGGLGVMAENDGLYFMRARFYEAETGRFLGKDPVEGGLVEPMSLHKYAYSLNNPIMFTDPFGMYAWDTMWSGFGQVGLGALDVAGGVLGVGAGTVLIPFGIGVPMTLKAGNTSVKGMTEIMSGANNIAYRSRFNMNSIDTSVDLAKQWVEASGNQHLVDTYNAVDTSLDVLNLIRGFTGKTDEYIRNIIAVINSSRSLISRISWKNNTPYFYEMDASGVCYYIKLQ